MIDWACIGNVVFRTSICIVAKHFVSELLGEEVFKDESGGQSVFVAKQIEAKLNVLRKLVSAGYQWWLCAVCN